MKANILFFSLLFLLNAQAQTLELGDAIKTALKNNLELQVVSNEAVKANNSNHPGNAGMLPSVSININETPALTDINQKFTNNTTIERNNVFSNNLNASLVVAYTLYDGSKMFAIKDRLELQDAAGKRLFEKNVQSLVSQVIGAYGDINRQNELLKVLEFLEKLAMVRLDLVEVRHEAGLANKTDLFLAKLDLESRKQAVISQSSTLKSAFVNLNKLLNFPSDSSYLVKSAELTSSRFDLATLEAMIANNPDILLAQDRLDISMATQREISSARLPLVRLTGAYNYNLSQSQAGFSLYNQGMGTQLGLGISIPLYNGSVNKVNIENAKLDVMNSDLQKRIIIRDVNGQLHQAWYDYEAAVLQLKSDSTSLKDAKDYIELMDMKFKEGQATILELIEAQSVFIETNYRYINNVYIQKLAETQLLLLTGKLVE